MRVARRLTAATIDESFRTWTTPMARIMMIATMTLTMTMGAPPLWMLSATQLLPKGQAVASATKITATTTKTKTMIHNVATSSLSYKGQRRRRPLLCLHCHRRYSTCESWPSAGATRTTAGTTATTAAFVSSSSMLLSPPQQQRIPNGTRGGCVDRQGGGGSRRCNDNDDRRRRTGGTANQGRHRRNIVVRRSARHHATVPFVRYCTSTFTSSSSLSMSSGKDRDTTLTASEPESESESEPWLLQHGMLLADLKEGILENTNPQLPLVLKYGLLRTMLQKEQSNVERRVEKSVKFSPCCGPTDYDSFQRMETIDQILATIDGSFHRYQQQVEPAQEQDQQQQSAESVEHELSMRLDGAIRFLMQGSASPSPSSPASSGSSSSNCLRVVFVPTALYATKPDSRNTPGKQRQRARADGKKRRDGLIRTFAECLVTCSFATPSWKDRSTASTQQGIPVATVTIDFDDGSVKQPEAIMAVADNDSEDNGDDPCPTKTATTTTTINFQDLPIVKNRQGEAYCTFARSLDTEQDGIGDDDKNQEQPPQTTTTTIFPRNAIEALQDWDPHVIYVTGGNTFWLYYCMTNNGYDGILKNLFVSPIQQSDTNEAHKEKDSSASSSTSSTDKDEIVTLDGGGGGSLGSCFYMGQSAGAILAGSRIGTASWKGWDDPTIIPNMSSHEDWISVPGLSLVGPNVVFPHMDDELWTNVVLEQSQKYDIPSNEVLCIHNDEVYYVYGRTKRFVRIPSSSSPSSSSTSCGGTSDDTEDDKRANKTDKDIHLEQ